MSANRITFISTHHSTRGSIVTFARANLETNRIFDLNRDTASAQRLQAALIHARWQLEPGPSGGYYAWPKKATGHPAPEVRDLGVTFLEAVAK